MIIEIVPVAKPRMTRSDKWKQRPCVMRYRAFADELRLKVGKGFDVNYYEIVFTMPMPESWSKKKKKEMDGTCHVQKPDIDNLLKSVLDALYGDDSHIHNLGGLRKSWGFDGMINFRNTRKDDLPW